MKVKWSLGNEVYTHDSELDNQKVTLLIHDQGGQFPCMVDVTGVSCFSTLADVVCNAIWF